MKITLSYYQLLFINCNIKYHESTQIFAMWNLMLPVLLGQAVVNCKGQEEVACTCAFRTK